MRVGNEGKQLFKEWEGLKTKVYLDSVGKHTIGIGHLITQEELRTGKIKIGNVFVDYRHELTEDQCWELLEQDLVIAEKAVNSAIKVPLNQNQFDALASMAFNIGASAFLSSTLVKLLNQGQYDQVPTQMRRWVRGDGKVVQGLVNRREKEIALWNLPV